MAAEATFKIGAVDATKAAFASVQNGLDKLSASAGRSGAALAKGVDIRHAMTSVAVAIGVSVDKIATGIARLITGVSEEQEKLFNELNTVSDAAFSSQEQLLKSRRSDEEQLAYLLNQRVSIEKKLVSDSTSGTQGIIDAKKAEIELNNNLIETDTIINRLEKEKLDTDEKMRKIISEWRDEMDSLANSYKSALDPQIEFTRQEEKLLEIYNNGKLTAEQYVDSLNLINEAKKASADKSFEKDYGISRKKLIEDTTSDLEKYNNQVETLNAITRDFPALADNAAIAIANLGKEFDQTSKAKNESLLTDFFGPIDEQAQLIHDSFEKIDTIASQTGDIISSGFEDAIFSGQKLSEVIRGIGMDLLRMVFQQTVTGPMATGISAFIKGMFRADGGAVSGNTPYIVGERGPELFVPSGNGKIVPNNQLGATSGGSSGTEITINYNIASGVSRADLAPILDQERKRLKSEIPDMVRRGGAYRAAFA